MRVRPRKGGFLLLGCEDIRLGNRREQLRATYAALSTPTPAGRRQWPGKPLHRNPPNGLPYLNQPLIPLAAALSRMLEKIENELADDIAGPTEKWRLRQRAELMRRLLAPRPIT
jgi:hypothetical protein